MSIDTGWLSSATKSLLRSEPVSPREINKNLEKRLEKASEQVLSQKMSKADKERIMALVVSYQAELRRMQQDGVPFNSPEARKLRQKIVAFCNSIDLAEKSKS